MYLSYSEVNWKMPELDNKHIYKIPIIIFVLIYGVYTGYETRYSKRIDKGKLL